MRCPVCGNGLIHKNTKRGRLDQCEQCLGMWLDKASFNRYAVWLACEKELSKIADVSFKPRSAIGSSKIKEAIRTCPKCNIGLAKNNYAYDSNIIIDKCKQCDGIWVDAFEINEIAEHIKRDPRVEQIGEGLITNEALEGVERLEEFVKQAILVLGTFT